MQTNNDDDPGGWRSFLKKLITTSVIDDCWGTNYALVADNFSDDSRSDDLGRIPSYRSDLADKSNNKENPQKIV